LGHGKAWGVTEKMKLRCYESIFSRCAQSCACFIAVDMSIVLRL